MRHPEGATALVQHHWDHAARIYDEAISPALGDVHRGVVRALGEVRAKKPDRMR